MLQPAIAFLEDAFGLQRRASVALLGVITACGAALTMYFSRGLVALDHTDFWCNLMMIIAATCQVLLFGWIIGAERGVREMNRGADFYIPRALAFIIRFVTPTFLIVILVAWSYVNLPGYLRSMNPAKQRMIAERSVYSGAIAKHFSEANLDVEQLAQEVQKLLGPEDRPVNTSSLPSWLLEHQDDANKARDAAGADANIARLVFVGILAFYIFLIALSDIACRNRFGRMIRQAEEAGGGWQEASQ
jgi:hypothetical protein